MKNSILLLIFLVPATVVKCQILFTESFSVILDSARTIQGSFTPVIEFQTQKENLFEFEAMGDISIRLGKNAITIASEIELTRFGGETILSGSYLYEEYRISADRLVIPELYNQIHWSEARGLERKYAVGCNARFRIFKNQVTGLFAAIGPFYEYENWNYLGVPESHLPADTENIKQHNIKIGSYLSYKHIFFGKFNLDLSVYHQSRFDEIFTTPRLASSSKIGFFFSDHLELVFIYQNIYDYKPVVLIDKWFHKYIFTLSISF
jgi:hypothetical protein